LVFSQSKWASSVTDYKFGEGQNFGQDKAWFPENVLGPLSNKVSPTIPASTEREICSLGKNGYIVLKFEPAIIDGLGKDFTIFENAFIYGEGRIYDEWMIVSVSEDGVNWHTFPYDTISGVGMAGRTPTAAFGVDYANPAQSGGDAFDLADLQLNKIYYIKVTDATKFQSADRESAELDAIIAIHQEENYLPKTNTKLELTYSNSLLSVHSDININNLVIIDINGKKIVEKNLLKPSTELHVNLLGVSEGVYALNCVLADGTNNRRKIFIPKN
jgi:hypothetical protein